MMAYDVTLSDFTDEELLDNLFLRLGVNLPEKNDEGVIDMENFNQSIEERDPEVFIGGYYGCHLKIKIKENGKIEQFIIESNP
jgi:hypothetical protein